MKENRKIEELCRRWTDVVLRRTFHNVGHFVRSTGLSMSQHSLLGILRHGDGCGVREIAKRMGITSAAASQLVDRLVQGGLVDRTEDPRDRRARRVRLSKQGQAFIDEMVERRFGWLPDLVDGLTAEEREAVEAALPALIRAEGNLPPLEHHVAPGQPAACRGPTAAPKERPRPDARKPGPARRSSNRKGNK